MWVIGTKVAGATGVGISRLLQRESVGRVAAVTPFLDHVAALAEGSPDFLRDAEIFSLNAHAFKANGVAGFLELLQLFAVTFPAFFGEDH